MTANVRVSQFTQGSSWTSKWRVTSKRQRIENKGVLESRNQSVCSARFVWQLALTNHSAVHKGFKGEIEEGSEILRGERREGAAVTGCAARQCHLLTLIKTTIPLIGLCFTDYPPAVPSCSPPVASVWQLWCEHISALQLQVPPMHLGLTRHLIFALLNASLPLPWQVHCNEMRRTKSQDNWYYVPYDVALLL